MNFYYFLSLSGLFFFLDCMKVIYTLINQARTLCYAELSILTTTWLKDTFLLISLRMIVSNPAILYIQVFYSLECLWFLFKFWILSSSFLLHIWLWSVYHICKQLQLNVCAFSSLFRHTVNIIELESLSYRASHIFYFMELNGALQINHWLRWIYMGF